MRQRRRSRWRPTTASPPNSPSRSSPSWAYDGSRDATGRRKRSCNGAVAVMARGAASRTTTESGGILSQPTATIGVRAERPYDVRIGHDLIDDIVHLATGSQRVALIHQQSCIDLVSGLDRRLSTAGFE